MSLKEINKDITTVNEGIILHGCNCQGVMGSGVAKAIRDKWPIVYDSYMAAYNKFDHDKEFLLGTIDKVTIKEPDSICSGLYVYNGFTQFTYGRDPNVKYADINAVKNVIILTLINASTSIPTRDVYMPPIGCGLGGLDYDTDLLPWLSMVSYTFSRLDIYLCDIQ